MRHFRFFSRMFAFVCVIETAASCFGQYAGNQFDRGYNTPTFSPYINLLRDNGGVGQNYYGLVRPQMEFAQQNQQMQQGLVQLQMQNQMPQQFGRLPMAYRYSQLGATGHPVIFNSFGHGQFTGGYASMAGGMGGMDGGIMGGGAAFGGGGMMGGMQGANQLGQIGMGMGGGMMGGGGNPGMGFGGVSGHAAQFGGIGNTYRAAGR